jgi:hypothetical protein
MGILAEIQTRTYHESSNKPTYLVRGLLEPRSPQPGGGPSAHEIKTPAEREVQTA